MLILGTDDGEVLHGTSSDDTIVAKAGDDIIKAGAGDDNVRAGLGDDNVFGGNGDDNIFGGSGDDEIRGGKGADELSGQAGADTFVFYAGADFRTSTDDDVVLDFEYLIDDIVLVAPGSYSFDMMSVEDDLVVEFATLNGVDRGSITFLGMGELSEGGNDMSATEVMDILNGTIATIDEVVFA